MENNNEIELPCRFIPVGLGVRLVFMIFSFIKAMFCCSLVVSKHATGGPCQAQPLYEGLKNCLYLCLITIIKK